MDAWICPQQTIPGTKTHAVSGLLTYNFVTIGRLTPENNNPPTNQLRCGGCLSWWRCSSYCICAHCLGLRSYQCLFSFVLFPKHKIKLQWGRTPASFLLFSIHCSLTKEKIKADALRNLPLPTSLVFSHPWTRFSVPSVTVGGTRNLSVDISLWQGCRWQLKVAVMPMHPVTSTLMYRGICTIPDILSYSAPVNLPEDEVEGENTPVHTDLKVIQTCEYTGVVSLWQVHAAAADVVSSCTGAPSKRRAVRTLDSAQRAWVTWISKRGFWFFFVIFIREIECAKQIHFINNVSQISAYFSVIPWS